MKITEVLSPIYSNPEKTSIDCLVTFEEVGQVPFTATAYDPEDHGKQLWNDLIAGQYGKIGSYNKSNSILTKKIKIP